MRHLKYTSLYYAVFYFITLLVAGLLIRDIPIQPSAFSSLRHLLDGGFGLNDPHSFAVAAQDIYQYGWVSEGNKWIIHLWPPGFMLLEAAILKLFGVDSFILLILQILSAMLFACVLTLLRSYLRPLVGGRAAGILPLLIFCFPVARLFLLEPMGVALGEAFAVGFLIVGILFMLLAVEKKSILISLAAGIVFALAAYFRSQFELFLLVSSIAALPFLVWQGWAWSKQGIGEKKNALLFNVKVVFVLLFAAQIVTLPWRIHNWVDSKTFTWVQTSDLVYRNSLASNKTLLAANGNFVITGAGNLACVVEPDYCDKVGKELFFKAFTQHIAEWYGLKLSVIGNYWFASLTDWSEAVHQSNFVEQVFNGIFLILILCLFPLQYLTRRHVAWPVLLWINVSIFSAHFVIFTLVHFEVRYFYFLKLYGLIMFIVQTSQFWSIRQKTKAEFRETALQGSFQ